MNCKSLLLATTLIIGLPGIAAAANHEVKMLNKGTGGVMVFEPELIRIAPGDTVTFKATDPGHNVETISGMLPAGAQAFTGKTGQDTTITFTAEGIYGVKCKPHYPMGMVAAIIVGKPANLDSAKAVQNPGKAGKKFETLLGGL